MRANICTIVCFSEPGQVLFHFIIKLYRRNRDSDNHNPLINFHKRNHTMPKAKPENDLWFAPFTTSISLPQPIGQRSHVVSVGNRRGKLSVSNPSAPIIRKVGEAIWKKVASNKHARITNKPASFVVETTQAMMHDGENVLNRLKTLADATKYPPRKKGETMAPYRSVSDDAIFSFMQIRNMVTGASTMTASTTMTHATLTVSDYPPTASQTAIDQIRADPNHVIYHIAGRPPPIQPQRMVNHRSVVKTTNERKQLKVRQIACTSL
jgi:hypothetical protein